MILTDLATSKVGGKILFATDDFFAVGENMIAFEDPVWDAQKYTEFGTVWGKWMDGWETRRKRTAGHDWCLLKLGMSGIIHQVEFDTAFFTGNQTPRASLQAACFDEGSEPTLKRRSEMGSKCTEEELKAAEAVGSDKWETILEMVDLKPGYPETRHNIFKINSCNKRWTHLRVNMFPDGGIARLRVNGQVVRDFSKFPRDAAIDLLAVENGGTVVSFTNAHYGHPRNLTMPGRGVGMYDGWETARNPNRPPVFNYGADGHLIIPGSHSAILKMGAVGIVTGLEVDTAHFKGNYPESCIVEGCLSTSSQTAENNFENPDENLNSLNWVTILPRTLLQGHTQHMFGADAITPAATNQPFSYVRFTIYPDGGVSRVRLLCKTK